MVHADTAIEGDIEHVIAEHLAIPSSGWSMGAFGAIAEFMRDENEALSVDSTLVRATSRGAIRAVVPGGAMPVAYETVSSRPGRWLHGIAFCLPQDAARMNTRSYLTEIGLDEESILEEDRSCALFDLGAGVTNVDAMIRTAEPSLLAYLRGHVGKNVIAMPDVMMAIAAASPHRVFESRMGRIEVRQRVGSQDADPPTPEGPHTHVLPKVLRRARTHSANLPIPKEMVPCLNLYPANPTFDPLGRPKEFDTAAHGHFQSLLEAWGVTESNRVKTEVASALRSDIDPTGFQTTGRFARAALRVAIRQLACFEGETARVARWRAAHDSPKYEPDDHHPDH
jgi:hypothetical protein